MKTFFCVMALSLGAWAGGPAAFDGQRAAPGLSEIVRALREASVTMENASGAAAQPTYKGSTRWTSGGMKGFSALEQLGVQKDAEQTAVARCREDGHLGCAAIASHITSCGSYDCSAEAVAKVVSTPAGMAQKTFKGSSRWTSSSGSGFSGLERLGVEKSADQGALHACESAGMLGCVAIGSHVTNCNTYSCQAESVAIGFEETPRP